MQRPQKIEQKVENVKVAKNLLRAKLMLKLRTEKQNKSGFSCVSILLQDKMHIYLKRHQNVGGIQASKQIQ